MYYETYISNFKCEHFNELMLGNPQDVHRFSFNLDTCDLCTSDNFGIVIAYFKVLICKT